ncbi:MAG: tetratricopeptide repeat protein [Muribaculaceae bacterium]
MKITDAISWACAALPLVVSAQPGFLSTAPDGFLSRGKLMLTDGNFSGALDQLNHFTQLPACASLSAEAQFHIAFCHFEQGRTECVAEFRQFIADNPSSHLVPRAFATIGDFHFFNGRFGEALLSYNEVGDKVLDADADLTLAYRKGYSLLRLGEFDAARLCFNRLAVSKKYRDAGIFFQGYVDYAQGNYDSARERFASVTSCPELSDAAQYYVCQILFARHEFPEVISRGRLLLSNPSITGFDGEINRIVGESQYHEGNDTEAARYINAYLDGCQSSPERTAQYVMGVLHYRNADFPACIDLMAGVIDADDALAQSAHMFIGHSNVKTGNMKAAAIAYEKAFSMPFDTNVQETAYFNYALTQGDGGRTPFNRSIDIFEQFLNRFPKSAYAGDVEDYLINAYINGNDYQRALQSISHIAAPSEKVLRAKQRVLYNLGVQALSNGKVADAHRNFSDAYALGNLDRALRNECNLWIGECQYRSGKYSAAAKSQEAFITGTNSKNSNFALAHYNLGYSRFQLRSYAAARTAFEKAVASKSLSDASRADAYSRIGDTYYYAKSYSEAASAYDRAYSTHHASGDYPLFQKAVMMGLTKSHAAKIEIINRLLKEYPNSPIASAAMLQKAEAYVAANDGEAAVNAYEEISNRFQGTADARKALLQKAITQRGMGNEARAIESYKSVISHYPTSEEATAAAEDLKLIYADRGELQQYIDFLNSVPNAPKLDVSEIDRLTFETAEKAYMAEKPSITKMRDYVKNFPHGAYVAKAHYYIARHEYKAGNYDVALSDINTVLATVSDANFAEDALAMKGDILFRKKQLREANDVYTDLASRASSHDNKLNANLGIMRTALELEQFPKVQVSADALLALGGLSPEEENEVTFNRAFALKKLKKGSDAVDDFKRLADNTRSIYGARAAFELADYYYHADNLKRAEKVLNDFIDAGTPHQYWLARGFILLADIYHKRGNVTEATQYLESLRNNYPGSDDDIFRMIDSRLSQWKKSSKKKK